MNLGSGDPSKLMVFQSTFNRPNLFYEVQKKTKGKDDVLNLLTSTQKQYDGKFMVSLWDNTI